jgi:hypothetical protein
VDKTPIVEEDRENKDEKDERCYTGVAMGTYAVFAGITGVILGAYGCL